MRDTVTVGIIGDYDPKYKLHNATNDSLSHASKELSIPIIVKWISTDSLIDSAKEKLREFDALWCAPGSPYKSFEGALNGIQFARTQDLPFLGTCGGFQHVIIEYARNVLGVKDADHEENNTDASILFVRRLTCSPFGQTMKVMLEASSMSYTIYGKPGINETYQCNFGLNPEFKEAIECGGMRVAGLDEQGEVRIIELPSKRFYVATLFVPQLSSSFEHPHPLVVSYLKAAWKSWKTSETQDQPLLTQR